MVSKMYRLAQSAGHALRANWPPGVRVAWRFRFKSRLLLDWLLPLVAAPYYHVRPSTDLIGVEVCAALKNFYALAVGYANGLLEKEGKAENGALMHNLAAGLFTQAIAEMGYLVEFLGGTAANVYGLPGAGDL